MTIQPIVKSAMSLPPPFELRVTDATVASEIFSLGQATVAGNDDVLIKLDEIIAALIPKSLLLKEQNGDSEPVTSKNKTLALSTDPPLSVQDALTGYVQKDASILPAGTGPLLSLAMFKPSVSNFPDVDSPYLRSLDTTATDTLSNIIGVNNTLTSLLITQGSALSKLSTISTNSSSIANALITVNNHLANLETTLTNCLSKLISIQTHTGDSAVLQQSAVNLLTDIDDTSNQTTFLLTSCDSKLSYDVCTKIVKPIPPHIDTNLKYRQTMSVAELVARAGLSLVPLTESSDGLNKTLTYAPVGLATVVLPAATLSAGGNFVREPQLIDAIVPTTGPNTTDQFTIPVDIAEDPWIKSGLAVPAPQVPGYTINFV